MRSDNNLVDVDPVDEQRQVAALIWRRIGKEAEVLLVTSRVSGHWLLPKGWPIAGKSSAEGAMQEAYEEAGVWGVSANDPVGSYGYQKLLTGGAALHCVVDVFALEAIGVLADWPERAQRRRDWFSLSKAADKVMEPDLSRFLCQCDERFVDEHFITLPHFDAVFVRPDDLFIKQKKESAMINAAQCRAARALVDWSIDQLATASGLSVEQITDFEANGTLDRASTMQVARALEGSGVSFVSERRGRGVGVRFKFGRQLVKRIETWENEGGPAAEDDIL